MRVVQQSPDTNLSMSLDMRLTPVSAIRWLLWIVLACSLACGEPAVIDGGTQALPAVVPFGKEDNFLSESAREYLVEGDVTIQLDPATANWQESSRLEKVRRLIPYKQMAMTWFLNAWVAPKTAKDTNSKYGGFNALTKNARLEDMDIRKVGETTYVFTMREYIGGPANLMSSMPAMDNGNGTWSLDLVAGRPTNEEIQDLTPSAEWFRGEPWKSFDPSKMSPEQLETVHLTVTRMPRSMDAWPDYARLFADGKVTIGVHFGWDYHTLSHLSESKILFNWLVKNGYTPPVSSYEQLDRKSGPFKRTIKAGNRPVKVEISLYWGKPGTNTDTDTDQGGRWLKKDMIKSLETREVVVYSGHSGAFWGFSLANWKKTEEGEIDDNDIKALNLPSFYQVVLAEGCETFALGSAFYANKAKRHRTNLDIITTTTYSTAENADPVMDFLSAMVGTTEAGAHTPVTYGELLHDLDWNAWDAAMYGVHGIDDNPHLHPYAEPANFCGECESDWDCGSDWSSNFCLNLGTDGQFCSAECTSDDGCPSGYVCAAVARGVSITNRACVPENFSCTSPVEPTGQVVINEVMADPPNNEAGDLNEDGWYHPAEDEFVELVNSTGRAVDLSGWTVADDTAVRFTFPTGITLAPHRAVVIFGGGDPSAMSSTEALVFTAFDGLRLANLGDTVVIRNKHGVVVDRMVYGAEADQDKSLVRATDGHPEAGFVQHLNTPASPGTRSDGTLF